ncbi:MAG: VWA domain-containing protein [Acidobacteria bacterium]|nr:VWA domain-containing protein [Acidobacteriota bacterium]
MSRATSAAAAALICAFCLLPSAFLGAQQVFRSGAQVVEVDARVFDKDGTFIADLTAADFEILEDGVAQPLVALTLVDAPTAPTSPPSTEATTPTGTHLPTTPSSQTWIFFFDINHLTSGANFGRARDAAAAFVRDRFRDGDIGGVIDGKGMVNGRLTSDRAEIVKAIEGVRPDSDATSRMIQITREWPRLLNEDEAARIVDNSRDALDAAVRRACDERPEMCANASAEPDVRQKAQRVVDDMRRASLETFRTVDALAAGLARMTGPKTIVFLSNGFVTSGMDTALRAITGQTARAGARVYAIDIRGLGRFGSGDNLTQDTATNEAGAAMSFDTQADGVNSLAVDTGGMMIRNENNFGRALDTIAADANRYYVLGYQPANTAFDGKYRSIEVRVKRPGARVRARRGYLALEPARMLVPRPLPPVASADQGAPAAGLPAPESPAAFAETANRGEAEANRFRPDEETRVRTLSEVTGGMAGSSAADARDGWEAYQRGDLEAALPLLERAAQKADVAPWALYVLGMTRAGLNDAEGAIAAWQRVRTAAPGYAAVYNDLAATYASQGKLSEALAMLRDAAARWPTDAEIQNGIGVILVRREAYDEAIEAFTKAAAATPDEPVTHLNLGRAYELRYMRNLRFVASQRRWIGSEADRKNATAAYTRCIELGGPYARRAAAALSRLEWNSRDRR